MVLLKNFEEQLLDYERDGAVCLRQVLEEKDLELLRLGFEKNLADPGPFACRYSPEGSPFVFRDDYCNWQKIEEYRSFIFSSKMISLAKTLMREAFIRFYHEHIFFKLKHAKERTPWHHDYTYYGVDCQRGLSFWIPLDEVVEDDGVEFLLGSHLWGKDFRPQKFLTAKDYPLSEKHAFALPDIDADPDSFPLKKWSVKPGDVIAFHMKTIHGQRLTQKPASHNRRTFVARWLSSKAVYLKREWEASPSFEYLNLKSGDPLPKDLFPLV